MTHGELVLMAEKQTLQEIKAMLERIEGIIDTRLIGIVEPEEDEKQAIQKYEDLKGKGTLELREI
jgi:hypothetical protein